jgi:hypothetical protein
MSPLPSLVFFIFPTLPAYKVSNVQKIDLKGSIFLLQLALHPPPDTYFFYHECMQDATFNQMTCLTRVN